MLPVVRNWPNAQCSIFRDRVVQSVRLRGRPDLRLFSARHSPLRSWTRTPRLSLWFVVPCLPSRESGWWCPWPKAVDGRARSFLESTPGLDRLWNWDGHSDSYLRWLRTDRRTVCVDTRLFTHRGIQRFSYPETTDSVFRLRLPQIILFPMSLNFCKKSCKGFMKLVWVIYLCQREIKFSRFIKFTI